jgi:hypothetical protein
MTDHFTDADLIRYLDGELTADVRTAIESSPGMAERLALLRQRSSRLSALLTTVNPADADVRVSADRIRPHLANSTASRRWFSGSVPLRAAAAIAVILIASFAVPPVRAWILGAVRQVTQSSSERAIEPPALPPVTVPAIEPSPAAVTYGFTVSTDTFEISLAQNAGELQIERGNDGRGSAEMSGVEGGSFLLMSNVLRIEGPSAATARYRVVLPPRVSVVQIHRAGVAQPLVVVLNSRTPVYLDLSKR